MRGFLPTLAALAAILALSGPATTAAAQTLSPAAQRGLILLRTHCSSCHAIDRLSESPLQIAPPLRTLHLKYPIESLRRPLTEGVLTNHPTMPVFRLDPDQVDGIITYLKLLEK